MLKRTIGFQRYVIHRAGVGNARQDFVNTAAGSTLLGRPLARPDHREREQSGNAR